MADKKIKISFEGDVTGIKQAEGQIQLVFEKIEKKAKEVSALTKERNSIIAAQASAYKKLSEEINRVNLSVQLTGLAQSKAFELAAAAQDKYFDKIKKLKERTVKLEQQTQAEILKIQEAANAKALAESARAFASRNLPAGTPSTAVRDRNPLTGQITAEAFERRKLEQEKTLEQARLRQEEEFRKQREFQEKADYNLRLFRYTEFANKVEEREKQALAQQKANAAERSRLFKEETINAFTSRLSSTPRFNASGLSSGIKDRISIGLSNAGRDAESAKLAEVQRRESATATAASVAEAKLAKERDKAAAAALREANASRRLTPVLQEETRQRDILLLRVAKYYASFNAIQAAQQAVVNPLQAGIKQQETQSALLGIFGNEKSKENLKFISQTADLVGQKITVLEESYRRFAPSAFLAGASQKQINQEFLDFSKVTSVLSLGEEKVNSLFLALDQIYAKGTVQSEEIKRQLGNVLPAAVEIGAKAYAEMLTTSGKVADGSVASFVEAMRKNEVTAKEFVPIFARLYKDIFAGVDDSVFNATSDKLLLNLNRVSTEYERINREIFSRTQTFANDMARFVADSLTSIRENINGVIDGFKLLGQVLLVDFVAGLLTAGKALDFLKKTVLILRLPLIAASAAVGVLALRFSGLTTEYDKQKGIVTKVGEEYFSLADIITNSAVIAFERLIAAAQTAYEVLNREPSQRLPLTIAETYKKNLEAISSGSQNVFDRLKKQNEDAAAEAKKQADVLDAIKGQDPQDNSDANTERTAKLKEQSFAKEKQLRDEIQKQIDKKYESERQSLELQQKVYDLQLRQKAAQGNPENIFTQLQKKFQLESQMNASNLNQQTAINKVSTEYNNNLEKIIEKIESGGKAGAVSPQGAIGKFQILPSTLKDPGFGLKGFNLEGIDKLIANEKKGSLSPELKKEFEAFALKNRSIVEQAGKDYLAMTLKRYNGDVERAAAAYNAGPGAEDKGIRPKETQNYVAQVRAANASGIASVEGKVDLQESVNQMQKFKDAQVISLENYKAENAEALKQQALLKKNLDIELLRAQGKDVEADKAANLINFEQKRQELTLYGLESEKKKLALLEQIANREAELSQLSKQENINERIFQAQIQELTNKSLVGKLKNYDAAQKIFDLQDRYIKENSKLLVQELALANTEEQRLSIQERMAALAARRQETVDFNQNFINNQTGSLRPQFDNNEINIENSRKTALTDLEGKRLVLTTEFYQQQKQEIENKYIQASILNNAELYGSISSSAEQSFGTITSAMIKMYGAQSEQARISFAGQKAFAAARATIETYAGASKALAEGGPYLGPVLAGIITAAGLVNVATILAQPMPAAHGGLTNVPAEQTYLLNKGERVLSPRQNRDFTDDLAQRRAAKAEKGDASQTNVRIINVMDESMVYSALGSAQGERIVMNIVNKNR